MHRHTTPELLESRIAPASAIGRVLGLPAGSVVDISGITNPGLALQHNVIVGGLAGFPTGDDSDFLALSTGDASKAYGPRGTYNFLGLDIGKKGNVGDEQHLQITVPVTPGQTHAMFDFDMMTDEFAGGDFDDFFMVTATPNGGVAETIVDIKVNDGLMLGTAPANSIYNDHTGKLVADYLIPAGATSVTFDFYVADRPTTSVFRPNDQALGDTTVAIDNFRFTTGKNVVWLNFEGGTINNLLTPGAVITVPAFQTADIDSVEDRAALISEIAADVAAKFSDFDIQFVLTQPASGDYGTINIGGSGANAVTLNADADPRLVASLGNSTTIADLMGEEVWGYAESDFGNTDPNSAGFVHSAKFGAVGSIYAGDSVETLQKRLEVTIAHEVAHSLGAPHVDDFYDDNIMAESAPRSPDATFEDVAQVVVGALPDGRTDLNIHQYLQSVLGRSSTATPDVDGLNSVNFSSVDSGLTFTLPSELNDVTAIVKFVSNNFDSDPGSTDDTTLYYHFDHLDAGKNTLDIPNHGPDTYISFFGSTTSGGPIDFFTGTPTGGDMTYDDGFVPLFDAFSRQPIAQLPAARGALGSLATVAGGIGFGVSDFTSPNLVAINPKTGFIFTDDNGDLVTVKLTSKTGIGAISLVDPDGDGKGSIDRIELQGTTSKDKLTITIKKPKIGGDGFVDINAIAGSALGTLSAKSADLTGDGVNFAGFLGTVTLHDVENGADILAGGFFADKSIFTLHDVKAGTDIVVGSQLKINAARIGDGTINVAILANLTVKGDVKASIAGDFSGDVTIDPGKILTAKEAKLNLLGPVTISGTASDAHFVVPGNAAAFKAAIFEHSSIALGYTPASTADIFAGGTFTGDFKLASFTTKGLKNNPAASFEDSQVIAAQLGAISLFSVDTDNTGAAFGVAAKAGLAKNLATVIAKTPVFKYNKLLALPQNSGDFFVKTL